MPAQAIPKNSVWTAMSYTPPRGRCNYKQSLMSPACPCLRFMLHPVKAATSFECDGCNHHASFHSMENVADEAVIKKWQAQEAVGKQDGQATAGAGKKRRRVADKPANRSDDAVMREIFEIEDDEKTESGDDRPFFGSLTGTAAKASSSAAARRKKKP